ncbi:hypothetical protein LSM04_009195 [Trypanosoma melophagium]|uniref:uncharacterized protein n=1 Tax=Trypanosoma melophagium TaxID=715481 RepID=UPI003519D88B|nr:hypothetical protein LSM04_009195 [Trypanosoma melophagium]
MNLVTVFFDCGSALVVPRALILLLLLIGCVEANPGPVRCSSYDRVHDKVMKCDDEYALFVSGVNDFCGEVCTDDEFFDYSEDDFNDDNWLEVFFGELSPTDNLVYSRMKYSDDMGCLSVFSGRGKRKESGCLPFNSVYSGRKKKQNKRKGNYGTREPFFNEDTAALHRALLRPMLPWRPTTKLSELLRICADVVVCMEFLVKVHKKRCQFVMLHSLSKYRRGCKVHSSSNPDGKTSRSDVLENNAGESSRSNPVEEKGFFFRTHMNPEENTIKSMRNSEKVRNEAVLIAE